MAENIGITLGQALKKALTIEVYDDGQKENLKFLPAQLLMSGFISNETAAKMKYMFYFTVFNDIYKSVHEECFEEYICNMIVNDYIFRDKFGRVDPKGLYDFLSFDSNPMNIDYAWIGYLNLYVPNILVKDGYVYFIVPDIGMYRVVTDDLQYEEVALNRNRLCEKLNDLSSVTEILGCENNRIYIIDKNNDGDFYIFDIDTENTYKKEGQLIGFIDGNAIIIRDEGLYACSDTGEKLLIENTEYETVSIQNGKIVINYSPQSLCKDPYYIGIDGIKEQIPEETLYKFWWEFVVYRLYSVKNNMGQTFHLKGHPSAKSTVAFYGPWQMTPPNMTAQDISVKIREITKFKPDNRNVALFLEMLKYVDGQNSTERIFKSMWKLMVEDVDIAKNNGVFSEEFVEKTLNKTVQVECYDENIINSLNKTVHFMHLDLEPFMQVRSGLKTIELRLYDEKRQSINVFDDIIFKCTETGEEIGETVVGLYIFPNFESLYAKLPLLKCGYNEGDVNMASPEDMKRYYSEEDLKRYCVVGIELVRKEIGAIYSDRIQRRIKQGLK